MAYYNILIIAVLIGLAAYSGILTARIKNMQDDIAEMQDNTHEHGDVDIDHPANWWNTKWDN